MLKFKSLTARFIFVGIIMLAFLAVYIYADFRFTQHMKGEARKMNLIGRERMLSIDIARHLLEIAHAPPPERQAIIEHTKAEIKIFEDVLYGARDGSGAWAYNIEPIHSDAETSQLKEII